MQWLNIMEGTPDAINASTEKAGSSLKMFSGNLAERITASIDKITTEYLGAAKPHFVAVGVTMAALVGSYALWEIGKGVVSYWLAGPLHLGANIKKYGTWAGKNQPKFIGPFPNFILDFQLSLEQILVLEERTV